MTIRIFAGAESSAPVEQPLPSEPLRALVDAALPPIPVNEALRVRAAVEELGDGAPMSAIADRAGVSRELADRIIVAFDDEERHAEDARDQVLRGEEFGIDPATGRPYYLARPHEPADQLQRPLSAEMIPIFDEARRMRSLAEELEVIRKRIADLLGRPASVLLNVALVRDHLEAATMMLHAAAPFCVCPSCGGRGQRRLLGPKSGGQPYRGRSHLLDCRTCGANKFISAGDFSRLSVDLQTVANGYREEDANLANNLAPQG